MYSKQDMAGTYIAVHNNAFLSSQVTRIGGLEAVINSKKWSEVAQPFHFPDSFTSKSFTLRRMYSKLLFDFEQVYFHRNTGPLCAQPGEPLQSESWSASTLNIAKLMYSASPTTQRVGL